MSHASLLLIVASVGNWLSKIRLTLKISCGKNHHAFAMRLSPRPLYLDVRWASIVSPA